MLPACALGAAADWPGRPRTDLEARLERLFTRGRKLAGTLIRLEGRHSGDGHRPGHGSAQTAHPDDGSRLAQQARYHAARTRRARSVQPETIGSHAGRGGEHPLGSRRGLAHTGPQWCTLLRRIKAKMMALEGFFRKVGPATGRDRDSILRRKGGGRPRNGCAVVRARPCVRHRHTRWG